MLRSKTDQLALLTAGILGALILGVSMWRRRVHSEEDHSLTAEAGKLVVGTRIHQQNASKPVDLSKVEAFVDRASGYADGVMIAVGCDSGSSLAESVEQLSSKYKNVAVIRVQPWGKFVHALNTLVFEAFSAGYDHILFQSIETNVSKEGVDALRSHFTSRDLVVGAAFDQHMFNPGMHMLHGGSSPWNTLAMWHVKTLALVGFLSVSDGVDMSRKDAGIEEVSCISLLQMLHSPSKRTRAKVVMIPGLEWETEFVDEERRKWQEQKMASKQSRAEVQLQQLGVERGRVYHIVHPGVNYDFEESSSSR